MAAAQIRPRQDADIPALVEALEDVYRTDGYPIEGPAGATAFLSPAGLLAAWVAVHDGSVVGQIVVVAGTEGQHPAVRAWVDDGGGDAESTTVVVVVARFFVRKRARCLGVGRALVEESCGWARERDLKIVMNVMSKDLDAMRLYEKVGFRRFGEGVYDYLDGKQSTQYFYVYE